MEPCHLDGSKATSKSEFFDITFQHGSFLEVGVNGCRIEDIVDVVIEQLIGFQARDLACSENEQAIYHLELAKKALLARRSLREQQGVINTMSPHESTSSYTMNL